MVKRKNRLLTDAVREIKNTRNRFFSLFLLSALAVAFLSGLRTTAPNMKYTADQYFDGLRLMDGRVLSTLGITEEDVRALAAQPGVETAEGAWSVDVVCGDKILSVQSLPGELNRLALNAGRLPQAAGECVAEQSFLDAAGLALGDTLTLDLAASDAEDTLARADYTVVGTADSPMYISVDRGSSTLGTGKVSALLFVPPENFTMDYYTAAYFSVAGMSGLNCYGTEYEDGMEACLDGLEGFADGRAALRYDEIVGEAQAELDDARGEYEDAKADADRELSDAEAELADARKELDDGWAEYHDGQITLERETADARVELADGERELADAYQELTDGEAEYADGLRDYEEGVQQYQDGKADYEQGYADWLDGKQQYEDGLADYEAGRAELDDGWAKYYEGLDAYEEGKEKLESGEITLGGSLADLSNARSELDAGWAQMAAQGITPDNAQKQLEGYSAQLVQAQAGLDQAKAGLDQAQTAYEAAKEISDGMSPEDEGYSDALAATAAAGAAVAELQGTVEKAQASVDGLTKLITGIQTLIEGEEQYRIGSALYDYGWGNIVNSHEQLEEAKAQLDESLKTLEDGEAELAEGKAELDDAKRELDDGWAELEDARVELEDAEQELLDAQVELADARKELDDGWADYEQGLADLEEGRQELDDETAKAKRELADAYAELTDGEAEYADGLAEYEEAKADAEEELADAQRKLDDAQAEIDDIDECEWYLLGRNTLAGYVNYGSDSERMSNLADVFPLIFFLVAALACLTTMTRMVEEQRTQIGGMKALGFTRGAISVKYIGYAFLASFVGGLVGAVLGCIVIPLVIYNAWGIMYTLPDLSFLFQPAICGFAILAAVVCTTGASLAACLSTLTDTPANLMRPRAPKAGKRVLLERIAPVWKRLSFIQKVTVRNLFRYKRRFWMTVIGIGGCTALIVTGFGIHNSIFDILDKQFDEISLYSATAGLNDDVTAQELSGITGYLDGNGNVANYLTSYQSTVDVTGSGGAVDGVNLFAVDDMDTFADYITLRHRSDGSSVRLPESGIVITEKLSELLDVSVGDSIAIDGDRRVTVPIGDIVENYVYHYIYLTEDYYEALFGAHPVHNTIMIRYTQDTDEISDEASTALMKLPGVSSYSHIAYIRDTFTDSMASIDYAVIIIILSAAALAFVVLYNLTNINITERRRELATLKVLGFYDKEVSSYVYRENIFLTLLGIAMGLFMGRWLHAWLVRTVEINMVMFGRTAAPGSYLWAAILTAVFSVVVNIVAHYSLKKIDMVESLKTVE